MARPRKSEPPTNGTDDPVTIDLTKPPENIEPVKALPDYGTPAEEPKAEPKDEGPDLAAQVEKLRAAEQAARERAQAAEQRAAQEAAARQADRYQSQVEIERSNLDMLVNAMAALQGESDKASDAYTAAMVAGDQNALKEAHRQMVRAEAQLLQMEQGKQELERQVELRRQYPQQQPPQYQQPRQQQQVPQIEQVLAGMTGLIEDEREWLRQHPDAIDQQSGNLMRLQTAYLDAQKKGLKRGSEDYFRFFEDRLGYASDDGVGAVEEREEPPRYQSVAAPVSRSSPGASTRHTASGDKITLTPQMREAARISGVSEHEYARNLQKLRELKRAGHYRDS